MPKRLLVFQHTPWEGPGRFLLQAAKKNNVELEIVKLWRQTIPPLNSFDGLVVLGGKPNADEEDKFPFLALEKEIIKKSISQDRPYLGICLGHQLLAEALGAKISENYCASIGFTEGFLTTKGKQHPILKKIPVRLPLFKWHSQAIAQPAPGHIEVLATSAECLFEAISVAGRPHIVGIQFDNNAAAVSDVEKYVTKDYKWIASFKGKFINPAAILADAKKHQRVLPRHFSRLFTNFIGLT